MKLENYQNIDDLIQSANEILNSFRGKEKKRFIK